MALVYDTSWFALRDRERVDFSPAAGECINAASNRRALPKKNLGVLEATGTWIVDDAAEFTELGHWPAADISRQIRRMLTAASPDAAAVSAFENSLREVLPR